VVAGGDGDRREENFVVVVRRVRVPDVEYKFRTLSTASGWIKMCQNDYICAGA
jgi:hypothetical protein